MYNKKLFLDVVKNLNETPKMKTGGTKGFSSNLGATNRLFKKNTLFKKNKLYKPNPLYKKKNYKKKTYDPLSMYFEDGGYIEADLTPEQINEYRKGGYIVEDISVPSLNTFVGGGEPGTYILDGYKYKKDNGGKWSYESGQPIDDGTLIAKLDQQAKPVGTPAITKAPINTKILTSKLPSEKKTFKAPKSNTFTSETLQKVASKTVPQTDQEFTNVVEAQVDYDNKKYFLAQNALAKNYDSIAYSAAQELQKKNPKLTFDEALELAKQDNKLLTQKALETTVTNDPALIQKQAQQQGYSAPVKEDNIKALDLNDPNHVEMDGRMPQTAGEYLQRGADILFNPLDAIHYGMSPTEEMPMNMYEYEKAKQQIGYEDGADKNAINEGIDFASWFTGVGQVAQGAKMLRGTGEAIYNAVQDPSLASAGNAALNVGFNAMAMNPLTKFIGGKSAFLNPSTKYAGYAKLPGNTEVMYGNPYLQDAKAIIDLPGFKLAKGNVPKGSVPAINNPNAFNTATTTALGLTENAGKSLLNTVSQPHVITESPLTTITPINSQRGVDINYPIQFGDETYKLSGEPMYYVDPLDYQGLDWKKEGIKDFLNQDLKDPTTYKFITDRAGKGFDYSDATQKLLRDSEFKTFSPGWEEIQNLKASLGPRPRQLTKDDFFTEKELLDLSNQQKKYWDTQDEFDKMYPETPQEELMRVLTGNTERDELFSNLYPNVGMPDFRSKFTNLKQEELLQNFAENVPSIRNQGLLGKGSLKKFADTYTVPQDSTLLKTAQKLKKNENDFFQTAKAKDVVKEMRGSLGLKLDEIDKATPEQLEKWRQQIVKKSNKQDIERYKKDIEEPYTGIKAFQDINLSSAVGAAALLDSAMSDDDSNVSEAGIGGLLMAFGKKPNLKLPVKAINVGKQLLKKGYNNLSFTSKKIANEFFKPEIKQFFDRPPGPLMMLGPSGGSNMVKKNIPYYEQLLNTYDSKVMSATNKKFYKDLISTAKKQDGMLTEAQLRELDRLKTGNFDFGKRGFNKESLTQVEPKAPAQNIIGATPEERLNEMYRQFNLPETKNKEAQEVFSNFKQRIESPEGKKRLKKLGVTSDDLLQKIKLVEDEFSYGYYSSNDNMIALNPGDPLMKQTVRHEIEHAIQNAIEQDYGSSLSDLFKNLFKHGTFITDQAKGISEIDTILSKLDLRKTPTPNKQWKSNVIGDEPVDINNIKTLLKRTQNATDYFATGSGGKEKSAFLGEVQQYMMDKNIIPKNSYIEVTPKMVEETFIDAVGDEAGGGSYLRLFNIMKPTEKNYEIIAKGLNKMLATIPVIGTGTATMMNNSSEDFDGLPQQKKGGPVDNSIEIDIPEEKIAEYLAQGYNVEQLDTPVMAYGGTPYEAWTQYTGTPWSEAKAKGLTDGSAEKNLGLLKRLEAGEFGEPKVINTTSTPTVTPYDQMVFALVKKGNTIDELVKQRVGTREGLIFKYPELFANTKTLSAPKKPGKKPGKGTTIMEQYDALSKFISPYAEKLGDAVSTAYDSWITRQSKIAEQEKKAKKKIVTPVVNMNKVFTNKLEEFKKSAKPVVQQKQVIEPYDMEALRAQLTQPNMAGAPSLTRQQSQQPLGDNSAAAQFAEYGQRGQGIENTSINLQPEPEMSFWDAMNKAKETLKVKEEAPEKTPIFDNSISSQLVDQELYGRQQKDNERYGKFMSRGKDIANRTDVQRNIDSEKFFADIAKPNSVIIDIGSALGNSDPKLAGVSVWELTQNPKIKQKKIKVIATDIPDQVKSFKEHSKNKQAYNIDYAEVPMTYNTPIDSVLKTKNLASTKDVYLRAANSIDLLMTVAQTKEHFYNIAKSLKNKNVTYLYNNMIWYKPSGETSWSKIGNLNNAAFDHNAASWKTDKNRKPYALINDKTGIKNPFSN